VHCHGRNFCAANPEKPDAGIATLGQIGTLGMRMSPRSPPASHALG